ncbi:MAG: PH domain-containing protein [Planctomycetota bacterium]
MLCPSCSAEVSPEAVYCHKCGQRLDAGDEMLAPVDPAAQEGSPRERFLQAANGGAAAGDDPNRELWTGTYSSKAMIGTWIGAGVLTIALLAGWIIWQPQMLWWLVLLGAIACVWIVPTVTLLYRQWSVRYLLTPERLVHESGILHRVTDRIETIDIDDVRVEQGIVERLFKVGTVRIVSSDRSHPELLLRGIDDVLKVAGLIDDTRRNERRRRGIHIESV